MEFLDPNFETLDFLSPLEENNIVLPSQEEIETYNLSEEKMADVAFIRRYTAYRRGYAPKRFVNETDPRLQLPDRSVLHYCTNFLDPNNVDFLHPDLSLPLIQHESYQKYFSFWLNVPGPRDQPFPVTDKVIFRVSSIKGKVQNFYQTHPHLRRIISEFASAKNANRLLVYDYAPLHDMRLMGTLQGWRKTEIILRSMLTHILKYPYKKNHFLYFPLSSASYSRSKFFRAFRRIDRSTLYNEQDPSYNLLVHLLGYIYGFEHDLENVVLDKNDKDFERLTKESIQKEPTTSLFNRIPESLHENINFVLSHQGKIVIYNLKKLTEYAHSGNFFNIFYRHVTRLKQTELSETERNHLDSLKDDQYDDHLDTKAKEEEQPSTSVPQELKKETPPTEKVIQAQSHPTEDKEDPHENEEEGDNEDVYKDDDKPYLEEGKILDEVNHDLTPLDDDLTDEIENEVEETSTLKREPILKTMNEDHPQSIPPIIRHRDDLADYVSTLEGPERKRAEKLLGKLSEVKIGGKSLEEHLIRPVKQIPVTELTDTKEALADPSTSESSIPHFDKHYLSEVAHQDIAKTLTSFMKHGLFVTDVKESHEHTRMNRSRVYKVRMVSTDGKSHSFSFNLPEVDKDGTMLNDGVRYRMGKQMIALPIAKVSSSRVNITTNYNKSIIERLESKRGSFGSYILGILSDLVDSKRIIAEYGRLIIDETPIPYEYSHIAQRYKSLSIPNKKGYKFLFNWPERFQDISDNSLIKKIRDNEKKYGVFCGFAPNGNTLYWDMGDRIHAVTKENKHIESFVHFLAFLQGMFPKESFKDVPYEYTTVKIMSIVYPMVFPLIFIHGLDWLIHHMKLNYRWVKKGQSLKMKSSEIRIRFSDGSMIFSRYPLENSLIFAGLSWCNTKNYTKDEFNIPDTFYRVLTDKDISVNRLKGITSFFDLLIDPVTAEVLSEMGEPTETTSLLLRANQMLTTQDHYQASSVRHHRLRGYERFSATLYNEMARQFASYQTKRGNKITYSVNPDAVYTRIMTDPTVELVNGINPIHELKSVTKGSFGGFGGRESQSFVTNDRAFPKDGIGVISEASPDNSKIGMIFNTVFDPNLMNIRGMIDPYTMGKGEPPGAKMLSVVGNLMPGTAQDDPKRANFVSVQLSHHVPCQNGDVMRVRTGTESIISQMVSNSFSVPAPSNGKITGIDEKEELLEFTPDPIKLSLSKSLTIPFTKTFVTEAAKNHQTVQYVTDKVPGNVSDKFSVGDFAGTIDDITPVQNFDKLPTNVKETYKGKTNTHLSLITLTLTPKVIQLPKQVYEYKVSYALAEGTNLKQTLVPNVTLGQKVKKGDVLIYNSGFFKKNHDKWANNGNMGVQWKHGVLANVALIETSATYEDGCSISKELSEKLAMEPAYIREVTVTGDTAVENMVKIGDHIESTDNLCVLNEGALDALGSSNDPDSIAFVDSLKQAVRARHAGYVKKIAYVYCGDPETFHPSLRQPIIAQEKREHKLDVLSQKSGNNLTPGTGFVKTGTKYKGVEFTEGTVMIEVTIEKKIPAQQADKICIMGSNKTVISNIMEKRPEMSETHEPIDVVFSATSIYKRIVISPFTCGIPERNMEQVERNILEMAPEIH